MRDIWSSSEALMKKIKNIYDIEKNLATWVFIDLWKKSAEERKSIVLLVLKL